VLGSDSVPELDSMWQKLANNPQVLQQMFSLPYTKTVLEGFEASPSLAQQVGVTSQFQVITLLINNVRIRLSWRCSFCCYYSSIFVVTTQC